MPARPTILTFVGYYLPGYKAGGPIRTIANMVDRLSGDFKFRIVTGDRDLGDDRPFEGIQLNRWTRVGEADVLYASGGLQTATGLPRLLRDTPHDIVYLNSLFSIKSTLLPLSLRRMGLTQDRPTVLAPRGELGEGALALKGFKKRGFLRVAGLVGLYSDLTWQASSRLEAARIAEVMGVPDHQVFVAPDLSAVRHCSPDPARESASHPFTVLFLSRVSRMKNLDFALRLLSEVRSPVQFVIHGALEDHTYWRECQRLIAALPSHVRVEYRGELPHEAVEGVLRSADLFLLPTRGENYGHAILEALAAGVPVLISDRTPWSELAEWGAGWVCPLDDTAPFAAAIDSCANDTPEACAERSRNAHAYADNVASASDAVDENIQMFRSVLRAARDAALG